jgi:hypothetical protein
VHILGGLLEDTLAVQQLSSKGVLSVCKHVGKERFGMHDEAALRGVVQDMTAGSNALVPIGHL